MKLLEKNENGAWYEDEYGAEAWIPEGTETKDLQGWEHWGINE